VELLELASWEGEGRVIVTFLPSNGTIDLPKRGIDQQQAGDLKRRPSALAEVWERPKRDVYDEPQSR
jgi:hypothetical protein